MVYKSKIDIGLFIPLGIILIGAELLMLCQKVWLGSLFIGLICFILISLIENTSYTIIDGKLLIKSGFLINKTIEIKSITKINKTKNPLASPALSLDRLNIVYDNNKFILLSPKEQEKFIAKLKVINPDIVIS